MDLRRTILPLRSFPKLLLIISTITITAGFKLKQNGCLPLNSGKHPCLNLNYSFFIQCPENWVHIKTGAKKRGGPYRVRPSFYWFAYSAFSAAGFSSALGAGAAAGAAAGFAAGAAGFLGSGGYGLSFSGKRMIFFGHFWAHIPQPLHLS